MKRYLALISLLVLTLFGLTWFMQVSVVHACLPPTPMPDAPTPIPYTVEDLVDRADYILVGTVISGIARNSFIDEAEIEVEYYLKGEGAAIIEIHDFNQTTSCYGVFIGERYIFFAIRDSSGTLQAYQLQDWGWNAAWSANDENIERVLAITNQSIAPYPMPLTQQITRAVSDEKTIWAILAVVLVGIIVSGFTMLRMRRDGRKSKAKRG